MDVGKEAGADLHAPDHPKQAVRVRSPNLKRRYDKHYREWSACTACPLHKIARCKVIGRGRLPADVLFIGEAPGDVEDAEGKPFVGPSGQILNRMIEAINARLPTQFTYAITNIVACRPFPRGAEIEAPTTESIGACEPRLMEFIHLAKPRMIVCLGRVAEKCLPAANISDKIAIVNCWHPSYILRNGGVNSPQFIKTVLQLTELFKRAFG